MKKIMLLFGVFSLFFLTEKVEAYTYQCLYADGLLKIEYNTDDSKAVWSGHPTFDNCGTNASNPCLMLGADPVEVEGTGIMGRLDQKYWKFVDTKGSFSCPNIYYYTDCYEANSGAYTCKYYFAPYKHEEKGYVNVAVSSINPANSSNNNNNNSNSNSSNVSTCTVSQRQRLVQVSNQIKSNFKTKIDQYISTISQNTNLSSAVYMNLSTQYENKINSDIIDAKNELMQYQNICDYGTVYSSTMADLTGNLKNEASRFWNVFNQVVEVAETNATNNGQSTDGFAAVIDKIENSKNNNVNALIQVRNDLSEVYNNYLDKYEEVTEEIDTCEGILTPELIDIINDIIFYVRIAVPILLIVLGSVDFGKVVLADGKDDLKKAGSTFIKRCIIAIAIFFVPTIINFLISIFNSVSDQSITDLINCGIK